MFSGAENAALESAASSSLAVTPFSSPPLSLVVGSIEYFLATVSQLWPLCSAALAALALASVLASTIRRLRFSAEP